LNFVYSEIGWNYSVDFCLKIRNGTKKRKVIKMNFKKIETALEEVKSEVDFVIAW